MGDWRKNLAKTPYLVFLIVLISIGVGTASALITITLAGNVIVTGDLDMTGGDLTIENPGNEARILLGTNDPGNNDVIAFDDGSKVLNAMEFAEDSIEALQVQKDTHAKLKDLIEELTVSQKEVLIMRHYMDMSFKEIADSTDVSINTALGRMRYALINLRKKMKQNNIAYDQNLYPR